MWDEAYNIALEDEFSLANILLRMRDGLGMKEVDATFSHDSSINVCTQVLGDSEDSQKSFYLYPTVFSGSMNIQKAKVKQGE